MVPQTIPSSPNAHARILPAASASSPENSRRLRTFATLGRSRLGATEVYRHTRPRGLSLSTRTCPVRSGTAANHVRTNADDDVQGVLLIFPVLHVPYL